jgi:hypothetical protein
MNQNFNESLESSMIADSSFTFKSLYESFYDSDLIIISFALHENRWIQCQIVNQNRERVVSSIWRFRMRIRRIRSAQSLKVLNVICRIEFESISEIFVMMIACIRRSESWYRSIISIEWWVSIETVLILILISDY